MGKLNKYRHRFEGTNRYFEIKDNFLLFNGKQFWGDTFELKFDLNTISPLYDQLKDLFSGCSMPLAYGGSSEKVYIVSFRVFAGIIPSAE